MWREACQSRGIAKRSERDRRRHIDCTILLVGALEPRYHCGHEEQSEGAEVVVEAGRVEGQGWLQQMLVRCIIQIVKRRNFVDRHKHKTRPNRSIFPTAELPAVFFLYICLRFYSLTKTTKNSASYVQCDSTKPTTTQYNASTNSAPAAPRSAR